MKGDAGGSVPQPATGVMDGPQEKGKGKFLALKGKLQAKGKDIFALKGKFHATGKGGKDPSKAKSGGSEPNSSKGKGQTVKAEAVQEKDKCPPHGDQAVGPVDSKVDTMPPPTMFSGFGELTEEESKLPPAKVLGDHELKVTKFLGSLSPEDLNAQVKVATRNPQFKHYLSQYVEKGYKFGAPDTCFKDLCAFDVWLKKMAISESLRADFASAPPAKSPPPPPKDASQPPQATPAVSKAAAVSKAKVSAPAPKATATVTKNDKFVPLELTPGEKEQYDSFWGQFKPNTNVSPSTTVPSASPTSETSSVSKDMSTGMTPEVKRKLTLDSPAGPNGKAAAEPPAKPKYYRRSTSVMSDGSGSVSMEPLVEGVGKTKRVKTLTPEDAERIKALTSIDQIPPDERKRQREALRRRMAQSGLRPGLLQKYQNAVTDADKFALLKAFMLDPSMQDVVIESHYVDLAQNEQASQWVEITLAELRKRYSSEAEKRFLQREILDKQVGRVHPQDSTGQDEEMKLYWVWQQGTSTNKHKKQVGTKLTASGVVPDNKAARQAVCDGLVQSEAPKTAEDMERDTFKAEMDAIAKLAVKARNVAEGLKQSGIKHQEASMENLGKTYKRLIDLNQKISDEVFKGTPFDTYKKILDDAKEFVEESVRLVQDVSAIKEAFDRRQAAEKRKAQAKLAPKKKAKAKAKSQAAPPPAELPEEWPEDDVDPELDGEELEDSEAEGENDES